MSTCIGKKCVSRFPDEECGAGGGCAARRVLHDLSRGDKNLPVGSGPPTENRYGNLLAGLGYAEGAWPTKITDAGREAAGAVSIDASSWQSDHRERFFRPK